ncbi:MAG: DnaB-like helicase C-terminal domain-containing protein [Candidatus Magnetobacterium sp. LHC-1]
MANTTVNNQPKIIGARNDSKGKILQEYWIDFKRQVEERKLRGKPEMPTGISFIDAATDGIHRGELWTVAGRSGGGKTSLALQIACNIGYEGKKNVLFISLEMKGEEIVSRMFCNLKEYDNYRLKIGDHASDFEAKEKDFLSYLSEIDFELVEYGYNFKEIIHIIETHYGNQRSPDLIVIDFAQLIDWQEIGDERLAIQEYVRKLAELAKTKNIAIMLVSQLRRLPSGADYHRPPDIIDLKGCIHGNSMIGNRKIKNIVLSQNIKSVLSYNLKKQCVEKILPSRAIYTGIKKCYEVITESGKKIIVSDETKFYTNNNKWIKSKSLKKGMYILCQQ